MYKITKTDLNNPSRFRNRLKFLIDEIKSYVLEEYDVSFNFKEIGDLLLSVCRSNDFEVLKSTSKKKTTIYIVNGEKVFEWIDKKFIPNTVVLRLDDKEVIKLLIFSMEITYQMFSGRSRATVTQKGFRERRRNFESILVDQFTGKLGEVFVKRFLEEDFHVNIELDWEPKIEKFQNDIVNAKRRVGIKSSQSLAGIWVEADLGYEYGIMVKCFVPRHPILQFFIEVCGFSSLIDFAERRLSSANDIFRKYINSLKERLRGYKCGKIQTTLGGYICGYFKTSEYEPVKEGQRLPYLDTVREERYFVPIY